MIRIERTLPAPKCLVDRGRDELRHVLDVFEAKSLRDEKYEFKAYRQKAVAKALEDLFHAKCAYCESIIGTVHPLDIEHFRPKAAVEVEGRRVAPGYYWLAAAWENLLPSCIYCNRQNRLAEALTAGADVGGAERPASGSRKQRSRVGAEMLLGKGMRFPLRREECRCRFSYHGLSQEEPLLLDPCGADDPEKHLEFDGEGSVRAKLLDDGQESNRGLASIEVFGLRRARLVKVRAALATKVRAQLALIAEAIDALEAAPGDERGRERLWRQVAYLALFLGPDEPYLAMVRALIDQQQPGLREQLPKIVERVSKTLSRAPEAGSRRS